MYSIGDLLVYGGSDGICKVADIAGFDFQGTGESRLYYVLKPLHQECVIYNPVDNTSVPMRPVIPHDEAERLIDRIPDMDLSDVESTASGFQEAKQVAQHYDAILKSRDCESLIKLTMSIHEKKQLMAKQKRDIRHIESAALKSAEKALFEEFSIALGIPSDQVQKYIESRVGAKARKLQ